MAREPAVVRIVLRGEFDLSSEKQLATLLRPAEQADQAIIDMAHLTYIDSTGLGCLISLKKRLGAHGGVVQLINVHPNVCKILTICKLDQLFEISAA